jgi:hypothetical protein
MQAIFCNRIVVLVVATLATLTSAMATPQAQANRGNSIEAIWRMQEFVLYVHTPGIYHSCSSIEGKIVSILEAVGAADVAVEMRCQNVTNNAVARIAIRAPVPADSYSIEAATTFDARSELIARLNGTELPTPESIERFMAEWGTVSLGRRAPVSLGPRDCDLLKSISEQILPHLSVRIVDDRLTCDRVSRFPMSPKLVVEALRRTV